MQRNVIMKDYSQNGEQLIIEKYFGDSIGRVLDIGANDGITLSNSYACILRGWSALLVEPSMSAFYKLTAAHKDNDKVEPFNVAISTKEETVDFYESGEHLGIGDVALLSTLKASEVDRWKSSGETFIKNKAVCLTFAGLMELTKNKKFDLITIDCEGLDYDVMTQINLREVGCKMLIVESNSIEDAKYITYATLHGMKLIHKNSENLIFTV